MDEAVAKIMTKIRMYSTIPIATQIKDAFAQLARLRLPVLLDKRNDHQQLCDEPIGYGHHLTVFFPGVEHQPGRILVHFFHG